MSNETKRTRLDMRFPEDLLLWAKDHARKKRISTTQFFIELVLKEKESRDG